MSLERVKMLSRIAFQGKVVYRDTKNNFILINIGKRDGVLLGMNFDVVREGAGQIATAKCQAYVGANDQFSLLVISEGRVTDIKLDDTARVYRVTPSPVASKSLIPEPSAVCIDEAGPWETKIVTFDQIKVPIKQYLKEISAQGWKVLERCGNSGNTGQIVLRRWHRDQERPMD